MSTPSQTVSASPVGAASVPFTVTSTTAHDSGVVMLCVEAGTSAYTGMTVTDNAAGGSSVWTTTVEVSNGNTVVMTALCADLKAGITSITATPTGGSGGVYGVGEAVILPGAQSRDKAGSVTFLSSSSPQTATASGADTGATDFVIAGVVCTAAGVISLSDPATGGATWTSGVVNQNGSTSTPGEISWRVNAASTTNAATWAGTNTGAGTGSCAAVVSFQPAAAAADQPPQESWDCYSDDAGWCDESALIEAATPTQPVDLVPLAIQLDETQQPWWDGYDEPLVEMLATLQEMPQPPPSGANGPEDGWLIAEDADVDLWREHVDFVPVGADAVILPGLVPGDEWPWHTDQAGHDDDYPPLVDDDDDAVGPNAPAAADQPPEDGFSPHFDEADLDELFVDDYANEEVEALRDVEWTWDEDGLDEWAPESAPVGADAAAAQDQPQPDAWSWEDPADDDLQAILDDADDAIADDEPAIAADAWPWDDAGDDDYTVGLDDDDAVGPDQPPLPNDDAWPWDDQADDPITLDEPIGADAAAALPALCPADDWQWLEEHGEDWAPEDTTLGADAAALAALGPDDAWSFDDEVDAWAPDDAVLAADAAGPVDQPPADAWDWWQEEAADEQIEPQPIFIDPPAADQPPDDAWSWFDAAGDDARPEDASPGADAVLLPSDLAGDDAWVWFEEWVADPWPDDVAPSADEGHGRRGEQDAAAVRRADVRTALPRGGTSTIRRG